MKHVALVLVDTDIDASLGFHDELFLFFENSGYFCTDPLAQDDFAPSLPNGFCTPGTYPGPYKPQIPNHDTQYSFDLHNPCPSHRGMHPIHTGS
jgi:hypothetical protein